MPQSHENPVFVIPGKSPVAIRLLTRPLPGFPIQLQPSHLFPGLRYTEREAKSRNHNLVSPHGDIHPKVNPVPSDPKRRSSSLEGICFPSFLIIPPETNSDRTWQVMWCGGFPFWEISLTSVLLCHPRGHARPGLEPWGLNLFSTSC